jgi:hypothetical protein
MKMKFKTFAVLCVAAAVAVTAVPAACAAGTNGAHHEPVKLGRHEGLLAAMQRGGCHYVFNWLPVVLWQNAIRSSQVTGLKKDHPLTLPDGCENKPPREIVRQAKQGLFLLEKGEEAVVKGNDRENLQAENDRLKREINDTLLPRALTAEANVDTLKSELAVLRHEKAAARSAGWRNVMYGALGGMFLVGLAWYAWYRRLKRIAEIVYNVYDELFGVTFVKFRRIPDTLLYRCSKCKADTSPVALGQFVPHLFKMHSRLQILDKPLPWVSFIRSGTDG